MLNRFTTDYLETLGVADFRPTAKVSGRLASYDGLLMEAVGLSLPVGTICEIGGGSANDTGAARVEAEVIGFRNGRTLLMNLGGPAALLPRAPVRPIGPPGEAEVGAALIDRTVKNPDKAKQVNEIVGEIVDQLKAGREQERGYHRQLYTLNGSYSAMPEDFTKILNEAGQQRMATSAKILTLRFRMKNLMTEDEWKALTDQMLSYSGKYQHGGAGAKTGY